MQVGSMMPVASSSQIQIAAGEQHRMQVFQTLFPTVFA
jgi:hypothetical protein